MSLYCTLPRRNRWRSQPGAPQAPIPPPPLLPPPATHPSLVTNCNTANTLPPFQSIGNVFSVVSPTQHHPHHQSCASLQTAIGLCRNSNRVLTASSTITTTTNSPTDSSSNSSTSGRSSMYSDHYCSKPKVYYASDSFQLSTLIRDGSLCANHPNGCSVRARNRQQRRRPNFYGITTEEEEDDEDEDENKLENGSHVSDGEDLDLSVSMFSPAIQPPAGIPMIYRNSVFICQPIRSTGAGGDLIRKSSSMDTLNRFERESVPNKSKNNQSFDYSRTHRNQFTIASLRFRSRKSIRSVSIRFGKIYDHIAKLDLKQSVPAKMFARTGRADQTAKLSGQWLDDATVPNTIGAKCTRWKRVERFMTSKTKITNSLWTRVQCLVWKPHSATCFEYNCPSGQDSMRHTAGLTSLPLRRFVRRYCSFRHVNQKFARSDTKQTKTNETTAGAKLPPPVAGIKKRPLSMTYDLNRLNQPVINYSSQSAEIPFETLCSKRPVHLNRKAHMVAAFEQSLSSMTTRLQQLSSSSELKDCELERLRNTIETLRKQGGSLVGVAKGEQSNDNFNNFNHDDGGNFNCDQTNQLTNGQTTNRQSPTNKQSLLIRRHTFNNALMMADCGSHSMDHGNKFQRHLSTESMNSVSSNGGNQSSNESPTKTKLKTKSKLNNTSWIRSSFSRAFKKNKTPTGAKTGREIVSDAEGCGAGSESYDSTHSVPSSPLMSARRFKRSSNNAGSESATTLLDEDSLNTDAETECVKVLRKQLREKEMQLTDMRLESLTSAHQLENMKELINQMRAEMSSLKQDNERLQRLMNHKSLASSQSSMTSAIGSHGSSTVPSTTLPVVVNGVSADNDTNSLESVELDTSGGQHLDSLKLVTLGSGTHTLGTLSISSKTTWDQLDQLVKKCFKEHLIRVDISLTLGITADSVACYRVGVEQVQRNLNPMANTANGVLPELLPFGYLVTESHINLQFKSALDSLAFDTLTPKSVLSQFVSLLADTKRLILTGPSGTGKTFLAHKLAEYLSIQPLTTGASVRQSPLASINHANMDRACPTGAIVTINVDHKNTKELRAYLVDIVERCEVLEPVTLNQTLPMVIILDNLHHSIDSLEEIFHDLHKMTKHPQSPYIIGTINQMSSNGRTVAINHSEQMLANYGFRFGVFAHTVEPVKGFLGRYLRRKWLETESRSVLNTATGQRPPSTSQEMMKIIDWISRVCDYLNSYLQVYCAESISIGPRLFISCPMDVNASQIWFTDLWNFSILPFIGQNLRELLGSGGQMNAETKNATVDNFVDPTEWVIENYPWQASSEWSDHLNRLSAEDIEHVDGSTKKVAKCLSNELAPHSSTGESDSQVTTDGQQDSQDSMNKINDPFLQMLLKLKEASEYSSQDRS